MRGKVSGASTRLAVSLSAALSVPTYFGPVAPTADGIASLQATGLLPNTRYYYGFEDDGVLDTAFSGTFRTHPVAAGERASFTFGAAGDAGLTGAGDASHVVSAVSNNPVFDTMRSQSAAEDWLFFSHLGDFHYRNIATATAADYRAGYNDSLTFNGTLGAAARQGRFYRDNPLTYVWDDHDFGPNNSNRTAAGNATANVVFRERVPHYTLPSASTINQSWQVGRTLFIASDVRSARDPNGDPQSPTKTMLGTAQKTWMESVLSADSGAEALVWITPSRWLASDSGTGDTWNSFLHERAEMVQMFGDTGWLDRMIQLTADQHNLSMCSGPANPWGGFPIFMFAGMDSDYGSTDPLYDLGAIAGRQQYGTVQIRDRGHTIELGATGWINGTEWKSHTAYVHVGNPILALDFTAGHVKDPFRPTVGTDGTVNDFTASRQDGGEARFVKTDGPRGTDAIGSYPDSVTVQVASDDQLGGQAAWRVHLGTSPDARIPEVHVDLAKDGNTTTVADAVAGANLGDKVTIANPPDDLPPDDVELIAEGYGERIGEFEWAVQLNTTQGRPWDVLEVADERGTGDTVEDFEDATLNITITNGGNLPWLRTNAQAHTGSWSLRSGAISNNQTSDAHVTVPAGASTLTFWYRTSSEPSGAGFEGDRLLVLVDGVQVLRAQGAVGWTQATVSVSSTSSVTFRYAKDNSTATGEDAVYIDDLTFTVPLSYLAGPDRPNRWDTSGSELVNAVTATSNQFLVHTPPDGTFDRAPWIQSSGITAPFPGHFPFDLALGGEVVRCTACTPSALDQFGRSASSGWGSATVGGAWSTSGGSASDYDVNGSVGRHSHGTRTVFRYTSLNSVSLADVEVRASITIPVVPTGDSLHPFVLARANIATGAYYFARLSVSTTSTVQLTLRKRLPAETLLATAAHTLPFTAGSTYRVRLQIEGSTVRAKAWPSGGLEPVDWEVSATDTSLTTGAVGCGSFVPTANTNALPVIFSFDDFEVFPQVMTVQRAWNQVSKAHAAGAPISLAQPAPLGL
ncbi:alkaline phosphatase D family protein [Streptomyces sp. DSM 40750]|uniref:alkaline phosphatase D family protein n=1 Tax=Streptomyces sp. DSM 40750 TaxID=2801030 RepID=UPI00214BDDFA|nr:alkaline phosphatase D family protein [Streptomyces sp. DSM 40750]UUU21725.1 alkaline phosphatase D family protein [Streptomyces sp. DSM 40750]